MPPVDAALGLPAEDAAFVPNRAVIDPAAITHNTAQVRSLLSPHTALMAVVKADGYGHGMLEAARAALAGGATWLGAAHPASGLALARAGLDVPILTWLYEPETGSGILPHLVSAEVDVAVSSLAQLALVESAAREVGRLARIHVKLDTGMGRGGVLEADVARLGAGARASAHVRLVGAMSHFHSADALGSPTIDAQAERFAHMSALLESEAGPVPIKHLANSAATLTRPEFHFDLVRPGIALYGHAPVPTSLDLRPAMTLTSRLALVKEVGAGQVVGYGATHTCEEPTTLGLVPLGYADGLHRAASNRGHVLVTTAAGALRAPQVGTISMDQIVVDLGPGSAARPGDEVVIFGDPATRPGAPRAEEWAEAAGMITYEVLTSINARVRREVAQGPTQGDDPGVLGAASGQAAAGGPDTAEAPAGLSLSIPTDGPEATRRVARVLAHHARAGDLLVLDGPLGAGKTTFTQGFASALDVGGRVASPTFVIARVHPALGDGPDLVHVDAYRLDEDWEVEDLDLDSDLDSSITLVEWGRDRVEHLSDSYTLVELWRDGAAAAPGTIELDATDTDPDNTDEPRRLTLTFVGPRYGEASVREVADALRGDGFAVSDATKEHA